jgi:hypothetical protein
MMSSKLQELAVLVKLVLTSRTIKYKRKRIGNKHLSFIRGLVAVIEACSGTVLHNIFHGSHTCKAGTYPCLISLMNLYIFSSVLLEFFAITEILKQLNTYF